MPSPIRKIEDKTSFRAVSLAIVFALSWLEMMIPLGVPGVKFGFSNLVILVFLVIYGFWESLVMAILKIILSLLLFNGFSTVLYTAMGTLASCLSMAVLIPYYRKGVFSLLGVSAIGGFFHISAQYLVAAYTMYSTTVFSFYGMAAALTFVTSVILGLIAQLVTRQLDALWEWKNIEFEEYEER